MTEQRNDAVREALEKAEAAMSEMFRYFDGGETRGSYDGRPERNQLREAWYHARRTLAQPSAPSPLEGEVQPMPDLEVLGEALFKLSARLKVSGFLDDDANHSAYGAVVAAFNAPSTLSTEAGSGEVRAWEYESPDGKERLVRCRRATAGEFPYWTERALTYAVAVAEAGKPALPKTVERCATGNRGALPGRDRSCDHCPRRTWVCTEWKGRAMSIFDKIDEAHEAYKRRHREAERLVDDECRCISCRSDMKGVAPCEEEED